MTAPRHSRRGVGAAVLAATSLAAALLLTACGGQTPNPDTDPGPQESGEGVLGTSSTGPTGEPPPPPEDYPDTARAYAEAVLAAWEEPDADRLGDLATAEVQEQLLEVPMPLDMNWHFKQCNSVLPNWVCVFLNDDGDRQVVQVSNDLLGEPHAAVAVALDLTEYPTSAVTYGREFVDAWRDGNTYRMRRLADDSLANELAEEEEPAEGYRACGDSAAGSTYVRIYGNGGPEYVLRVTNSALGDPDAISDSVPPPNPPACVALIIIPSILPTIIITG